MRSYKELKKADDEFKIGDKIIVQSENEWYKDFNGSLGTIISIVKPGEFQVKLDDPAWGYKTIRLTTDEMIKK